MARGAGAALATLIALAIAVPGAAATSQGVSQRIFSDLADNGRLDGHYTRGQIARALHSPSLRRFQVHESRSLSEPLPSPRSSASDAGNHAGTLPFSGLDLALFGGVGAPLLLLGASLGRLARVRAQEEV
jgi:hypothetical protein